MLKVLLIRHGQTDWNAAHRMQGHEDVPLNNIGLQQAKLLARRLATLQIDAIYCSDLSRAAETAKILGSAHAIMPTADQIWRERDVGHFKGLTWSEVLLRYPQVRQELSAGRLSPPSGENSHFLYERAKKAYLGLLDRHQQGTVAVVSHGGTLSAVIAFVLGTQQDGISRFSLRGNTGVSVVEVGDRGSRLTLLNDTCHLERPLD